MGLYAYKDVSFYRLSNNLYTKYHFISSVASGKAITFCGYAYPSDSFVERLSLDAGCISYAYSMCKVCLRHARSEGILGKSYGGMCGKHGYGPSQGHYSDWKIGDSVMPSIEKIEVVFDYDLESYLMQQYKLLRMA